MALPLVEPPIHANEDGVLFVNIGDFHAEGGTVKLDVIFQRTVLFVICAIHGKVHVNVLSVFIEFIFQPNVGVNGVLSLCDADLNMCGDVGELEVEGIVRVEFVPEPELF